jgi:hypothetical protein
MRAQAGRCYVPTVLAMPARMLDPESAEDRCIARVGEKMKEGVQVVVLNSTNVVLAVLPSDPTSACSRDRLMAARRWRQEGVLLLPRV